MINKRITLSGWVPWQRTLAIMFVAQMLSAIGFSLIFPFLSLYITELGSTTGLALELWIGLVYSAQATTMAIASPIWGALADRYGRKLMVERAMFGGSVILLLMAFARSAEQLVLLRALQGLITGTIAASNALVAAVAPRERTGYAMGMLQVGLRAGLAAGPLLGGLLADTWGFRVPFVITSALLFVAGLIVWQGVHEHFQPGWQMAEQRIGFLAGWHHILAAPGVGLTYLMRFMSLLGQQMIVPIAPLFIQSLLPSTTHLGTLTGLATALTSVASTLSAVYLGRLGDRVGHRRVLAVSALAAAALFAPQSLVQHVWQLLVLQTFTGAAVGGIIPSLSALLTRYSQPGQEGAVFGLDNSVVSAGRAVAPIVSVALAYWFGLRATFLASAVMLGTAALVAQRWLPVPPRARLAAQEGLDPRIQQDGQSVVN